MACFAVIAPWDRWAALGVRQGLLISAVTRAAGASPEIGVDMGDPGDA
ncbi:hypothetical protein [Kyrpidia spormannii]|nr:hypothetical protein [Kyrpidia spormannii]